jgi:hypothetical protein
MKFAPLTIEEIASSGGYTHRLDLSTADIPAGIAVNTAYTWNVAPLPAMPLYTVVRRVLLCLTTTFKVIPNDAAFNTSTFSVGDNTLATRYISAVEINENGTEVIDTTPGGAQDFVYTTAGQLQCTLNSMAAKTISSLNSGKLYVLFQIDKTRAQSRVAATPFTGGGYT